MTDENLKLRHAVFAARYPDGRILAAWGDELHARPLRIVPPWRWRLSRIARVVLP